MNHVKSGLLAFALPIIFLTLPDGPSPDPYGDLPNRASDIKISRSETDTLFEIPLVDHHVHVFGNRDRNYLVRQIERLDTLPPLGIPQYLEIMNKDGVEQASLLSNAYFFSPPGPSTEEQHKAVRADNRRIAEAVEEHPNSFAGFFSVNPLSANAQRVLIRNTKNNLFSGIKLQLANSKVDLTNPIHQSRLARVFATADSLGLGIVVHLRTGEEYGAEEARIFLDRILPRAPSVPIQIAHLAGWGGYDPQTDEVLGVFARRIADSMLRENVYFDLSAVIRPVSDEPPEIPAWYPEKRYERMAEQLQKIGMNRLLFGTDWPDWSPADYRKDLVEHLPLEEPAFRTIFSNRAPWFK